MLTYRNLLLLGSRGTDAMLIKDIVVSRGAKQAIDSFLQQSGEDVEGLAVSAPEANGYEFQSSGPVKFCCRCLKIVLV